MLSDCPGVSTRHRTCGALSLAAAVTVTVFTLHATELIQTPAPAGPYHVSANQILDREGRPYLLRGTELAPVTLDALQSGDLGALSASAFVTIRQRLNMNAVELPLDAAEFSANQEYRERTIEIVRTANRLDLLVVLSPRDESVSDAFWPRLAAIFRAQPNVFFDARNKAAVAAIRGAGAPQPAIVDRGNFPVPDPNVIYRIPATYADAGNSMRLSSIVEHAPVLAAGLDPRFSEKSAECAAFPGDPAAATERVQSYLNYFDRHNISWIISAFVPGLLITDTRTYTGTKLDDGWTCGVSPWAGLGMVLLAHLWRADPHGLFIVNQGTGGYLLARGARATAYGPTMADHTMGLKPGQAPPTTMDNVSVRITDSRGDARLAPIYYAGAGWSFLNFVVPKDVAMGPAEIAIVRKDGSQSAGRATVSDIAPGFYSASMDARGPAAADVTQRLSTGAVRHFRASSCTGGRCSCVPIPLSAGIATTLRLSGTGFRHAHAVDDFQVWVGETPVPVVSFGSTDEIGGDDQLTIRLPDSLIGIGETDVFAKVRGLPSNIVRVSCGGKR